MKGTARVRGSQVELLRLVIKNNSSGEAQAAVSLTRLCYKMLEHRRLYVDNTCGLFGTTAPALRARAGARALGRAGARVRECACARASALPTT